MLATPCMTGCGNKTPTQSIEPGAAVPHLSATAHDGTVIDLGKLEGKPLLVYFYPKDDTPGCTKEACAFRDVWNRYEEAGIRIVGVSADDLDSHRAFAQEYQLPFPLISDPDLTWAKAFGVETMMGMHARNSVLIAPDGTIAKIYRDVDPGVHADAVLSDASAL